MISPVKNVPLSLPPPPPPVPRPYLHALELRFDSTLMGLTSHEKQNDHTTRKHTHTYIHTLKNRGYFGRLKHAGKPPAQRTLKVDTEASRRFIDSALSGDSVWKSATSKRGNKSDQAVETGIGRSTPAGQPDNYVQLQQQRIHEERELQGKKVPEETPSLSSVATTPGKRKHNSSDNTTTGKRGKQVNNGNGNGEDRSSSSSSGVWSGRNETGAGTIGGEAKWGTRPSATDEGGGGEGGTGAKKSPSGGNKSKGGGGKKGGTRYHQRKW